MDKQASLTKTSEKKGNDPVSAKTRRNFSQKNSSPVEQVKYLHRNLGNQAVQRLYKSGTIQAKLKIGKPNDKYEQEADHVADQVMRMPVEKQSLVNCHSSLVQRKSTCPECMEDEEKIVQPKPIAEQITPLVQREPLDELKEEEEEKMIQPKPIADQITPLVQREPLVEEKEEDEEEQDQFNTMDNILLQRQFKETGEEEEDEEKIVNLKSKGESGASPKVTPTIESNISSLKGRGQPLSPSTRSFFEPRFGYDFSKVRVHTDAKAADTSSSINAKAFTTGKDVMFGAGQYSPETSTGKQLLAHELTHVVQQEPIPKKRTNFDNPHSFYRNNSGYHTNLREDHAKSTVQMSGNKPSKKKKWNSDEDAKFVEDFGYSDLSPYEVTTYRLTAQGIFNMLKRYFYEDGARLFFFAWAIIAKAGAEANYRGNLKLFYLLLWRLNLNASQLNKAFIFLLKEPLLISKHSKVNLEVQASYIESLFRSPESSWKINPKFNRLSAEKQAEVFQALSEKGPNPYKHPKKLKRVTKAIIDYASDPMHDEILKEINKYYELGAPELLAPATDLPKSRKFWEIMTMERNRKLWLKKIAGQHHVPDIMVCEAKDHTKKVLEQKRERVEAAKKLLKKKAIEGAEIELKKRLKVCGFHYPDYIYKQFSEKIIEFGGWNTQAGQVLVCFLLGKKCEEYLGETLKGIEQSVVAKISDVVSISDTILGLANNVADLFEIVSPLPTTTGFILIIASTLLTIWTLGEMVLRNEKIHAAQGTLLAHYYVIEYVRNNLLAPDVPGPEGENVPLEKIRKYMHIDRHYTEATWEAYKVEAQYIWTLFRYWIPLRERENFIKAYIFAVKKLTEEKNLYKALTKLMNLEIRLKKFRNK